MAAARMSLSRAFGRTIRVEELQQQDSPDRYNLVPGVGIISYLPLQISLYFNVFYSPIWIIAMVIGLEAKFMQLAEHYKYITIVILLVMLAIEILRLYLGYEGNLREKVPELAGFWILSLFQLPLVVYLMANINTVILPLEWAICIPLVVFLLVEIITGLRALQLMVRAQAVKFQLSQIHPGLEMRERRRKRRRLSREGGGTGSDIREHET